ncbi:MAG: ATP12 family protein [Pseudomonadota bacterium]
MKRFWKLTTTAVVEGGYEVRLDEKPIRTPGKAPLILPNAALAEAMAAEWEAQLERVNPTAMPITRAANTAIDRVAGAKARVVDELAGYGETDLLCYRADRPEALAARQAALWDPLLAWADETFGARLVPSTGVMYAPQEPDAVARLRKPLEEADAWQLTALHELVTLSGSLVIALATARGHLAPEDAWTASRVDEDWNIAEWGEDAEAAEKAERRRAAFHAAARLLALLD